MLGGNFSFGGLGYPIYDPKSIACAQRRRLRQRHRLDRDAVSRETRSR